MLLQHLLRSQDHAPAQGEVHDELLEDVEEGQRLLCGHRKLLELPNDAGVLLAFILLCREVLHRFVVHQRVQQAVVRLVVILRGGLAEPFSPKCDLDRGIAIQVQVETNKHSQACILELEDENQRHCNGLSQSGHEVQKAILHGVLGSRDTTVNRADYVAALLAHVPIHGEAVEMCEGRVRDFNVGSLLHLDVHQGLRFL
mmetsp:Transcript_73506/g.211005  ORF Transcript_73506/g.211005 Transcript_73506/m.211005 type:complete len:200 (+) Transcript_73506:1114-1713(+)